MSRESRYISVAHRSVGHAVSPLLPCHSQKRVARLHTFMFCSDISHIYYGAKKLYMKLYVEDKVT